MTPLPTFIKRTRELCEGAKEIPGMPGYWADQHGNIWSENSRWSKWHKMSPAVDRYGYLKLRFPYGEKRRKIFVHRLMCLAFHGARPSLEHEVRHLNGKRPDNRPENLVWGTRSENAIDRTSHGTCKAAENGRKGAKKLIRTTCLRGHNRVGNIVGKKSACKTCHRDRMNAKNRKRARIARECLQALDAMTEGKP